MMGEQRSEKAEKAMPEKSENQERKEKKENQENKDYSGVSFQENGRLKLLILVGTRPEIIRLSEVIKKCRNYFDCILAHTDRTTTTI